MELPQGSIPLNGQWFEAPNGDILQYLNSTKQCVLFYSADQADEILALKASIEYVNEGDLINANAIALKADKDSVFAPITVLYTDLDSSTHTTYTNLSYANKLVQITYKNPTTVSIANANFNSVGVLTMPFTPVVGMVANLIGNVVELSKYARNDSLQYKGTFSSIELALSGVLLVNRHLGDTVGILNGGIISEYWWKDGVQDINLIQKTELPKINNSNLFMITDLQGAIIGIIDNLGKFNIKLTESVISDINIIKDRVGLDGFFVITPDNQILFGIDTVNGLTLSPKAQQNMKDLTAVWKEVNVTDVVWAVMDKEGKLLDGRLTNGKSLSPQEQQNNEYQEINTTVVLSDNKPYDFLKDKGKYVAPTPTLLLDNVVLVTTAVGRQSAEGAGDAPTVNLTNTGYTHPSVVYLPNGLGGYTYWMAITPTFGPIAAQSDPASFENPTIFASNDGLNWVTPNGLTNPLDVSDATNRNSFWSDTHLTMGDDGYLHLFYRGCSFPNSKLNVSDGLAHTVAIVHRKSKDGVNWSAKKMIFSSSTVVGTYDASDTLSPAFINNTSWWHCYDFVSSSVLNPLPPMNNQSKRFIYRRVDKNFDGSYGDYTSDKIINFTSRPWGSSYDPWHLDAKKVGNMWFLLLACGNSLASGSDKAYIAYSGDGWNFEVISTPIFSTDFYRSSLLPISYDDTSITFHIYRSKTSNGSLSIHKLTLLKP